MGLEAKDQGLKDQGWSAESRVVSCQGSWVEVDVGLGV